MPLEIDDKPGTPAPTAPAAPPPTVEPAPEQPSDYTKWPWPWNLLQKFLIDAFEWAADIIVYWINKLELAIGDKIDDLSVDLTDLFTWVYQQVESYLKTVQTAIEKKIEDVIAGVHKKFDEITEETQELIDERVTATQTVLSDATKTAQTALDVSLTAAEVSIKQSVTDTQGKIDSFMGGADTIAVIIRKEVGPAIFTFIGAAAGPFLAKLNASLEAT